MWRWLDDDSSSVNKYNVLRPGYKGKTRGDNSFEKIEGLKDCATLESLVEQEHVAHGTPF